MDFPLFLYLPRELRDEIYDYVIASMEHSQVSSEKKGTPLEICSSHRITWFGKDPTARCYECRPRIHVGTLLSRGAKLLFVNRQIHAEYVTKFYAFHEFAFWKMVNLRQFLDKIGNHCVHVRRICITQSADTSLASARRVYRILTRAEHLERITFEARDLNNSAKGLGPPDLSLSMYFLKALGQRLGDNLAGLDLMEFTIWKPNSAPYDTSSWTIGGVTGIGAVSLAEQLKRQLARALDEDSRKQEKRVQKRQSKNHGLAGGI